MTFIIGGLLFSKTIMLIVLLQKSILPVCLTFYNFFVDFTGVDCSLVAANFETKTKFKTIPLPQVSVQLSIRNKL